MQKIRLGTSTICIGLESKSVVHVHHTHSDQAYFDYYSKRYSLRGLELRAACTEVQLVLEDVGAVPILTPLLFCSWPRALDSRLLQDVQNASNSYPRRNPESTFRCILSHSHCSDLFWCTCLAASFSNASSRNDLAMYSEMIVLCFVSSLSRIFRNVDCVATSSERQNGFFRNCKFVSHFFGSI